MSNYLTYCYGSVKQEKSAISYLILKMENYLKKELLELQMLKNI